MAFVNEDTVRRAARLARLRITKEGLKRRVKDLADMLDWIEQLDAVDTENVEPLANVADITLALRSDEVTDGGDAEKVLANAPAETQGFYVVPKVVEQDS